MVMLLPLVVAAKLVGPDALMKMLPVGAARVPAEIPRAVAVTMSPSTARTCTGADIAVAGLERQPPGR